MQLNNLFYFYLKRGKQKNLIFETVYIFLIGIAIKKKKQKKIYIYIDNYNNFKRG